MKKTTFTSFVVVVEIIDFLLVETPKNFYCQTSEARQTIRFGIEIARKNKFLVGWEEKTEIGSNEFSIENQSTILFVCAIMVG